MKLSSSYLKAVNLLLVNAVQTFKRAQTIKNSIAMLPGPFYLDNFLNSCKQIAHNISKTINEH